MTGQSRRGHGDTPGEPASDDRPGTAPSGRGSAPRTGVLVITAWTDATVGELRYRVVSNDEVVAGIEQRFTFDEPEEVLECVSTWLTRFRDARVTSPGRRAVRVVRQDPSEGGGEPGREDQ